MKPLAPVVAILLFFSLSLVSANTHAASGSNAKTNTAKSNAAKSRATPAKKSTSVRTLPKPQGKLIAPAPDKDFDAPVAANSMQAMSGTAPRFLFSSGFGVHVLGKPGLALQMQLLWLLNRKKNYYIGPDFTYSIFAPGTSLTTGVAAWYDMKIYGAPRLSCLFGLIVGPSFNNGLTGVYNTALAMMLDLGLVQEVDDLISVKGQFRPGIIGNAFSYVMSFQVAFRFL